MMSLVTMMQHAALSPEGGLEDLEGIGFNVIRGTILPSSRQSLAREALETGVSHTLWIDTDMAFPKDTLHRLARADKDMIGINARGRRPPYPFLAEATATARLETKKDSTGIVEVHRVGFGLVLIKTDVFRKMDAPFFDFEWLKETASFRGEDYYFCEKARTYGVEFWVDHDLSKQVAHIGDFAFMP
jgi:hypothetical protein